MIDEEDHEVIAEDEEDDEDEEDYEGEEDEEDYGMYDDDEEYEDDDIVEEKKRIFIPIIQGSDIIELKINGGTLPLRGKVPFEDFSQKLMPLLFELQNFVDLENFTFKKKTKGRSSRIFSGPWDEDSFYSFWSALNEKQKEFVKIVYENEEISRENLIKDLIKEKVLIKDDPKLKNYFAGLSAGLTRKWNNLELEPIWSIKKDKYVMNQKPLKILIEFFENLEE